ncbi:MAG: 16S rRNA (guanine(527)-N(7))-methyltransferase RsmG [Thermovirgaceae bacterium]|jgi:16S rRNA (guanine527-N7)-methyltransferase|nr:16S rRNA (guanine(527)-N(7))-methyltransferase RsmG [Thermovirga sp.]
MDENLLEPFPECSLQPEDYLVELERNRERIEHYAFLLASFNERARLTGPTEPPEIMAHIRDCAVSLVFAPDIGAVVDIGTGGGLPGIVWALCRPNLKITLLESVAKKCDILDEMARMLRLSNVDVACARSEALSLERRESFRIALSRGVGHLGVVAEYASPLLGVGGFAYFFKGPRVAEELRDVGDKWATLGFDGPMIYSYDLDGKNLCLVGLEKSAPCPAKYPRRPGKASKSSWWR